jgi:hypothetical protein
MGGCPVRTDVPAVDPQQDCSMNDLSKILIFLGLGITAVGAVIYVLSRLGFRGLPGDIQYESENVRFYFPIVTCIVLSVLLTLGMWLWRYFTQR